MSDLVEDNAFEKLKKLFIKPKLLKERTIFFNQSLPKEFIDSKTGKPLNNYDKNDIRTTKYTPFSFIPKNLIYQFSNIANIYFLILIILGAFQIFGVQSPGLAAVPLIVIVILTAIKDAFEDSRRTISDLELNNNPISILIGINNSNVDDSNKSFHSKFNEFNSTLFVNIVNFFRKIFGKNSKLVENIQNLRNSFETINSQLEQTTNNDHNVGWNLKFSKHSWKDVKVGDIVRIHNNEEAPADLIILATSDEDGKCFVETKNLDGETNLKPRKSLELTNHIKRSKDFESTKFKIRSEAPNLDMYNYRGSLTLQSNNNHEDEEEPINIENLILRGSSLKNTKWVIGIALFTGHESKIMLNLGMTPSKKSRISKELNLSVILNFCFLFILCFISGLLNGLFYRKKDTSFTFFEYKSYGGTPVGNGILSFFVAMILYQALVPISLYISVEIIKTCQAYFIYSDVEMYYDVLDYPCTPKTWNISDDLGQIEYIFSDKTGTLTQNIMEFKKTTINGKKYGLAYTEAQSGVDKRRGINTQEESIKWGKLISDDKVEMIKLLKRNDQFDADKLTFISSEFIKDLNSNDEQSDCNKQFMLYLSLCHTVLTEPSEENPNKLEFRAESPDEAALVQVASDIGCSFKKRTRSGCIVNVFGEDLEFEILKTLEFNSTRKRMSVIGKIDDKLILITKGADSIIYQRLSQTANNRSLLETTANHLEDFANEGLRTLCIAGREISNDEWEDWSSKYNKASASLENREEQMEELAAQLETNLILYGGTAIEDRLQIGVPESIEKLSHAGIKLWILTGDKVETAINIGFSCNLLGNDMELLVLKEGNENIDGTLTEYLAKFNLKGDHQDLLDAQKDHSIPKENSAMIIDGATLTKVFENEALKIKFLILGKQCKSVICCRVSPSQKAQVVKLVKNSLKVMTLSIGDGANDVAMIQTANVGVGIIGEEGRQAAMSSDYAIGQFRFLQRLLLVHGRWDYKRLAEMIPSFFYKNVCFTLTLFWYGIYNNFDGSYLLEYTMILFYNLAYTSLPVIFLGIFDQDVSDSVSLRFPQLYKTGILRQEWSQYKFIYYMIDGLYQSVLTFYLPFLIFNQGIFATYNGLNIDHRFWIGTFVTHISVTSSDIYILLRQYRWDWLSLLIDALSILVVFFWCGIWSSSLASGEFYKNAAQVYGSLSFWVCFPVGVILNIMPRFVYNTWKTFYKPRDIDIIRECVAIGTIDKNVSESETGSSIGVDEEKLNDEIFETPVNISRFSNERLRTSLDLPELSQAQSLVKSFTHGSNVINNK
ncbi:hypothetical protein WICMUC_003159 [Wickerhamomyces mucosus]|uniref:Phospholipid-transporting ATPase n=1 Tax=Wickerhamomyces mucosus TaxID=1378264 RepID=A0A9P8TCP2_9ASCO|nr:hypothetical protein WICMUC_003159 [Wickerhamomyces mucosus]